MMFETQTIDPASNNARADSVSFPPLMRCDANRAVAHSAPKISAETSPIESARSGAERRSIFPDRLR